MEQGTALTDDGHFAGVFGRERGTRYLEEREDRLRFGVNYLEVRALISGAAAIEKFPGYVDNWGMRSAVLSLEAASIGWDAGCGWAFSDDLRMIANETLTEAQQGSGPLRDALLATMLKHLLPDDLYTALMARWWQATNDPRWQGSEFNFCG